jgi:drug/metabolite transporter (DMT)-like permease
MTKITFLIVLSGVLLNAAAQLLLKAGTNRLGTLFPAESEILIEVMRISFQPFILSGLSCYVLSVALWIAALSKAPVSLAYPMLSIGYIVNAVAAYYLLGESLTAQKMLGVLVIIIGVYLVAKS